MNKIYSCDKLKGRLFTILELKAILKWLQSGIYSLLRRNRLFEITFRMSKAKILIVAIGLLLLNTEHAKAQDQDTVRAVIGGGNIGADTVHLVKDSTIVRHEEISPLDIGSDRGLFILSSDHLMQMRILGSVRTLITYNNRVLENLNSLNPYEIPTNVKLRTPNVYAGLNQSRLGFEVTRRTKALGDVFIRLESDFRGNEGSFRVRHAYGQTKSVLVGQTWSLFGNVSFMPATIDLGGPIGSMKIRTPQIRYFKSLNDNISWYAGLEFSTSELESPDTVGTQTLQVIPDFTGKVDIKRKNLSIQVSALITTISVKLDGSNDISYSFGFGGSVAGKYNITKRDKLLFSATIGKSIAHFLNIFSGKGEDAKFNSIENRFIGLGTVASFIAYNRTLSEKFNFYYSMGFANTINKGFQPDSDFDIAYNGTATLFWEAAAGARLGLEYTFGQRFDIGNTEGFANRVAAVLYFDF